MTRLIVVPAGILSDAESSPFTTARRSNGMVDGNFWLNSYSDISLSNFTSSTL